MRLRLSGDQKWPKFNSILVFAGWENKRTTLRRKRQDQELTFTYTDEILTKNCPLKLLIEITTGSTNNECIRIVVHANNYSLYSIRLYPLTTYSSRWHKSVCWAYIETDYWIQRSKSIANQIFWIFIAWTVVGTIFLWLSRRWSVYQITAECTVPTCRCVKCCARTIPSDTVKCDCRYWSIFNWDTNACCSIAWCTHVCGIWRFIQFNSQWIWIRYVLCISSTVMDRFWYAPISFMFFFLFILPCPKSMCVILMCELWMQINNILFGTVIGNDMNRQVSINKIANRLSTTLANYRRGDIFLPSEILNLFVRISRCKYPEMVLFFLFSSMSNFLWIDLFSFPVGKIEVFSKHDHTQFRLLASVDDPKYSPTIPLRYISFASFNNTPIQFYYDCSASPLHIDTEMATRYANPGHPVLLEDPTFQKPIDKRNCKLLFSQALLKRLPCVDEQTII